MCFSSSKAEIPPGTRHDCAVFNHMPAEERSRRNSGTWKYRATVPSASAQCSLLHVAGQDVAIANIGHRSWIEIGERAKDVDALAPAQPAESRALGGPALPVVFGQPSSVTDEEMALVIDGQSHRLACPLQHQRRCLRRIALRLKHYRRAPRRAIAVHLHRPRFWINAHGNRPVPPKRRQ